MKWEPNITGYRISGDVGYHSNAWQNPAAARSDRAYRMHPRLDWRKVVQPDINAVSDNPMLAHYQRDRS